MERRQKQRTAELGALGLRFHTRPARTHNVYELLDNPQRIKLYLITITLEEALASEIARIANLSVKLGYQTEAEDKLPTKEEAYTRSATARRYSNSFWSL
jgi:hypothetical protein